MAAKQRLKHPSKFDHTIPVPVLPPPGTADEYWVEAFWEITKAPIDLPPEPAPPEVITHFEKGIYAIRRCIFADVIRRKWDPTFKLKGIERSVKQEIQMFGEVAFHLLNLCEATFLRQPVLIYEHPAQWFTGVVLEGEAWGIHLQFPNEKGEAWGIRVDGDPNAQITKTKMLEILQKQNRHLKDLGLSNPFLQPATKKLFERAREIAAQDDCFRQQFYRPYREAREKSTTYFRKNCDVNASGEQGRIRKVSGQGRKKAT